MESITIEIDTALALSLLSLAEEYAAELEGHGASPEQAEQFLDDLRRALGMT